MIDLHSHILPAMDDGAADLQESLEIARQLAADGVTCVAATPHFDPSRSGGPPARAVRAAVTEVQRAIEADGVRLNLVAGHELFLTPDAVQLLETGVITPLGSSSAVLVETTMVSKLPPVYLADTLFQLQVAGYQPVLAHPERYLFVQEEPDRGGRFIEAGVALQLTAPSLLGEYGPAIRRTATALLKRGWYTMAASDTHHPGQRRSLGEMHERLTQIASTEVADLLLRDNPGRLLAGEATVQPDPVPENARGPFGRLFRR